MNKTKFITKTKNGKKVRIICTNRKDGYNTKIAKPIIGLVTEEKGVESVRSYTEDGIAYPEYPKSERPTEYDLIMPLKKIKSQH